MLYFDDVVFFLILTCGEICSDAFTQVIVQFRVQDGSVLGVRTQIPQWELGDSAWDPLLDGVGALDAQEKTIARYNGTGSLPYCHRAVWADVSKAHIGGSIRFWRSLKIQIM